MKRPLSLFCFILCFILAASAKFSTDYDEKYGALDGRTLSVWGTVDSISFKKKDDSLKMILYLKEGLICYMDNLEEPKIGSRVRVSGRAFCFEKASNPGQFDSREYYEILGIKYGMYEARIEEESEEYSRWKDTLYRIRRSCSAKLDEALPENEAAVMKTMLLGEKTELDSDMKELYQRNGIAHILCISGLHISLLGMGIFKLLRKCRIMPVPAAFLSSLPVILYGVMTGLGVSSVRAIFMFCLSMTAVVIGRTYDLVTAVSVAMLLILGYQPLYIYHSGFVFSFGCVIGIGFLMPTLVSFEGPENSKTCSSAKVSGASKILWIEKFPEKYRGYIEYIVKSALSAACMVVIGMPVYYWFYYQIPVYSGLLNFLVVPVMSILVPCGILLIGAMYIWPMGASLFRIIIVGILEFFDKLAQWADGMPFHYLTPGRPQIWQVIIYIIVLGTLVILRKKLKLWIKWTVVLAVMLMLTIRVSNKFETCFIDVGQGDSILVRTCDSSLILPGMGLDHAILVDGGSTSEKEVGKYRIIPFLKYKGVNRLEAVIVTHTDEDHINGIIELLQEGELEGIRVETLVIGENLKEDMNGAEYDGEVSDEKASDEKASAGEVSAGEVSDSYSLRNVAGENENLSELLNAAQNAGIKVAFIKKGDSFSLGKANVECLWPLQGENYSDINESSIVLRVRYGNFEEVLTGDIQGEAEEKITEYIGISNHNFTSSVSAGDGKITLLKCAHHGSRNSTKTSFLEKLRPQITIISCGLNNSYGHPHKETLQRLETAGSMILRTDEVGEIEVITDGKEVRCRSFLKD